VADRVSVLGFAGSLRQGSYNRAILRAALHPPETLRATLEVAERCEKFELRLGRMHAPRFRSARPTDTRYVGNLLPHQ
jgi:hypothetical protein